MKKQEARKEINKKEENNGQQNLGKAYHEKARCSILKQKRIKIDRNRQSAKRRKQFWHSACLNKDMEAYFFRDIIIATQLYPKAANKKADTTK